ncbi:MAG: DNA polymerase I [Elusimicrobiota bacterium]
MKKFYIIDGNSYIHRAYHALPQTLTTSSGMIVNAVYGFTRMLWKVIQNEHPDYLAVCIDTPQPTFRHEMFPEYKATRKTSDDELKNQFPLAHEVVKALNISLYGKEGFEADDLIASLAKKANEQGIDVVIISADKDILQIVNEHTFVLNDSKNILYNSEQVEKKYGLKPAQLPDFFGLTGDKSDNVPGVPGVGEKTALDLIQRYENIENILKHLPELKEKLRSNFEQLGPQVLVSKKLVTLKDDIPLEINLDDCRLHQPDRIHLLDFLKKLEFYSLYTELISEEEKTPTAITMVSQGEIFQKLIMDLKESKSFAFQIETTDDHPLRAKIIGFSFVLNPLFAFYLPIDHNSSQLNLPNVLKELKPIWESEKIRKFGYNLKRSYLILSANAINLKGIKFDPMIASYLLNPSKIRHDLEDIALEYLLHKKAVLSIKKHKFIDKLPVEELAKISASDADLVFQLWQKMDPLLIEKKLEYLFYEVEMPLLLVLAGMEKNGIKVDVKHLEKLSRDFTNKMSDLERQIYRLAEQQFNINSPKQLAVILFEKLHLPTARKTKTGYSTDEEVLRSLASAHPLPAAIIEYRQLQKMKSTYVDSLISLVNSLSGRIHTSFNQTVTSTGRLSSSEPNLQNIPIRTEIGQSIRRAFIPEKEWIFLSADYSQIDLRVMAHVSGDEALVKAFRQGGDIHLATASEVFNIPAAEVTPEIRNRAKAINFGIIYGQTAYGLSESLGLSQTDAQNYIDKYFTRYSGVKNWIDKTLKEAREKGFVTTLLNRRRYLPEINSTNNNIRSFAERIAVNTPIQGTAADIIKVAMLRIDSKFKFDNLQSKMLVQVHDDLLFEVLEKELAEIKEIVKKEMEGAMQLSIPLLVEIKTGPNWGEMG